MMPSISSIKAPIQLNESEYNPESFYELIVYSEWRQDPISWNNLLKRTCSHIEKPLVKKSWFGFIQTSLWPEQELLSYWSLLLPWLICVSPSGQYVALLQDGLLEIRCSRDDYATVVGRAAVSKDEMAQCRRMVWSPNSVIIAISSSEGIVSVYDFLAAHLFTIPKPAQKSINKRYVVGLELIDSPIKLDDWSLSLIVVYSDGMVHLYQVSEEGFYKETVSINLSQSGISSATFCQKYQVLFISTKPNNVPATFKDSSVRAGISGWKLIAKSPFFKRMFPTEEELKMVNRANYLWKIKSCMNSVSCVAKMVVSPSCNWIASYHCCGGIKVWYNPSLRLHRRWDEVDRKNQTILEDDLSTKKRVPLAVDIEWLTDEALVVSWDNGTISVHNIHNFGVTYGSDPKLVHGRLRVSSSLSFKGFLALECELVFISIFGEENVVEDDENEKSEWLDATSEFIQAVLYAITDNMDYYKPARRPNQLTRRIYRLLGIKSVTPEERYYRYLEDEQYDKALKLAKTFKLDVDKVYQKQWKVNAVSSLTISEYLVNIHDEDWVLNECISRVPETLPSLHLLLDFALNLTDFKYIFPDIEFNHKDNINIESLTEAQKFKLKTRLKIFRYLDKLEIYELILEEQNLQYDMKFFEKIREKHMVEIAIIYAQQGNYNAVATMLRKPAHVLSSYLLVILSNFPETLNPEKYSNILPKCNSDGELINFKIQPDREHDWVQSDKFRELIEDEKLAHKYTTPLLSSEYVTEWYRVRAVEIEWFCGIIQNSVKLLRLGKSFNVQDLDELLADFSTLEVLVVQLKYDVDFLTFKQWPLLDKGYKLLEKSSDESFTEDFNKYLIPFLNRCSFQSDKERFELILNIMVKKSETNFKQILEFFRFILSSKDNVSLIGGVNDFVTVVELCCYSYENLDLISETLLVIDSVITFLNSFNNRNEYQTSLNSMYTIRDELKAAEILKKYKIIKSIAQIHSTKHSAKDVTEIIQDMTKLVVKIVLKLQTINTAKLHQLLEDILHLQNICFTTFPIETCYEIFASAMLAAESMDLIEFSANFICCHKQEEFSKAVTYNKSIELILKSARNYFNYSRTHLDEPMYLAKACLHIVKDDNIEIIKELDLIQAVRLLAEFGVNLLPLQIRNCEERMKLVECVLNKDKTAYKNLEKLYKLACKLSISPDDYSKRYAIINIKLAEQSYKLGDYKYCSELCENLMSHICEDGWDICLKLGSSREFNDAEFKLKLLNFAYIYAPSKAFYGINEKRTAMEKEVIFNKLSNNPLTCKSISKIKADFDKYDEYLQLGSLIKNSEKSIDRCELRTGKIDNFSDDNQIMFELTEYLLKSFYSKLSSINENSLTILDKILLECGRLNLRDDSSLAIGLSLLTAVSNKDLLEDMFANLPSDSYTFQLAIYFYAIVKCISSKEFTKNKYYLNKYPNKVVEKVFHDDESNDELSKMMIKYKMKNDEYLQAKTANSLNCGIDTRRFISDMDYRRDTISGLAMCTDLDNALTAIELAKRNHISAEEIAVLHLESFLREPTPVPLDKLQKSLENPIISKIIFEYPELLKTRLLNIFEHLDGCNYSTLAIYFTLYNAVDSVNTFHSLTAKQHLKLMKKVKATSLAINYVDLISDKKNLLDVLQPALDAADNFNNVIKLVKNLPESIRGSFNVNVLYRRKAVDEFSMLIAAGSISLKQCIKQVENIFNKWLYKVDVGDIKLFLNETVWHRKSAIAFHYEHRRQIILTLVSSISNRDDYRENVKYLTNLIQERLDNMDKVWNIDEDENLAPLSNSLKSYLFDLEEIGNNNERKLELMKKIAYDSRITKDELSIAYKASGLNYRLNELFEIFAKDDNHFSDNSEETCSEPSFSSETLSQEKHICVSFDCCNVSNENLSFETRFERLLCECKTTAQIKILYTMLDELRSSESTIDIRTFQIRLLHKLVAIKSNDGFNLVAKLMDESCLDKKEILELVTNNKLTGDILTLVWICIQGNTPELEKLATEFINELSMQEINNIGKRIKSLPWDLIKLLISSKCFKTFITDEENYLVAYDLVKVLAEIQLLPEASTLFMSINGIPESLRSFNTALILFH